MDNCPRPGVLVEDGRSLRPNDLIELEVEELGRLRNQIVRKV